MATSTFWPTEPGKVLKTPLNIIYVPLIDNPVSKQGRHPLDIDLNVPDQRVYEGVASVIAAS